MPLRPRSPPHPDCLCPLIGMDGPPRARRRGRQTSSAAPVVLPDAPPAYAGCPGTAIAHHDIQHKTLGAVRLFLIRSSDINQGCIAAITNSGQARPPLWIDVGALANFAFANPATDATGNTFVLYNPGRYDGVLVPIPNTEGFEDIGWDHLPGDPSFNLRMSGKHAYYYASSREPHTRYVFDDRGARSISGTVMLSRWLITVAKSPAVQTFLSDQRAGR